MTNIMKILNIHNIRTTAYRPQGYAVERVHRTINGIFGKLLAQKPRLWCEYVPAVAMAYNSAFHSSTTCSPFFLVHIRPSKLPFDLLVERPPESESSNLDDFTEEMLEKAHVALAIVRQHLNCSFNRAKKRYDSRVKSLNIRPGNFVWYYSPQPPKKGLSRKWMAYTTGPYRVQRNINVVNHVIQRLPTSKPFVVHIDRLEKFKGEIPVV
jgi:hypothetical protein